MKNNYFDLLKEWCDKLITLQLTGTDNKNFDGGLLCPACKLMHGRSDNAIFPFLFLAEKTGDSKYINAAKKVFDWHENFLCDDGSAYNDANNAWIGTTVFSATDLCEALMHYGTLLDCETREKWEKCLKNMANWLYENLTETYHSNINYQCTNTLAMALTGIYFKNQTFTDRAARLLKFSLSHFTENGLLYGEGKPIDGISKNGCRPIDIGYNVEESVPSLTKCAILLADKNALAFLTDILHKQLDFMLPDGAWDNSFGNRNNKWTYWGSRTSDGCISIYAELGKNEPVFLQAAKRNADLLLSCTHNGLLHGGPDYHLNGEEPCIHHTFCHAVALAHALECGLTSDLPKTPLPQDSNEQKATYYPELNVYKITQGPFRATITGYDFDIKAGHASGGVISLLWHEMMGPVIAGSVLDYKLNEPLNMQLPLKKKKHRSLLPRAELFTGGIRYSQSYDTQAEITCQAKDDHVEVSVHSHLVSIEGTPAFQTGITCHVIVRFGADSVTMIGKFDGTHFEKATFILPIVRDCAKVNSIPPFEKAEDIFFLTGGFTAKEYTVKPDENGCFCITISKK